MGELEFPKGFLEPEGRPLIEASLRRLRLSGVERVVIVTGHQAHFYEKLAGVECVYNPHYAESGSLYSLWCASQHMTEDFLLLESDILYEQRALEELQKAPWSDCILLSGATHSGDEVYVETEGHNLKAMSKDRSRLGPQIAGELVGITRVSQGLFRALCEWAEIRRAETLYWDYETDGLVGCAQSRAIHCLTVEDLVWGEIDDAHHLQRALTTVVPRLRSIVQADLKNQGTALWPR